MSCCLSALVALLFALPVTYQPPVDAPVVDPFRPPATPYGPGNRGLDYATASGAVVVAAGDGVVTFAGQVGGTLHVTVRHGDGIRTSYSFLQAILVVPGQRVRRGDPLGRATDHLHVGARIGGRYVDPARLWDPHRTIGAHLVPLGAAPPAAPPADGPEDLLAIARTPVPPLALLGGQAVAASRSSM